MCGSSLQTRREVGDTLTLADRIKAGEVRTVSRLITLLENEDPGGVAILRLLVSNLHRAAVIGITGYPGAGKSTVIAQLVAAYRRRGMKVGILAVDISSPVTGGALNIAALKRATKSIPSITGFISGAWPLVDTREGSLTRLATQRWCWRRLGTRSF